MPYLQTEPGADCEGCIFVSAVEKLPSISKRYIILFCFLQILFCNPVISQLPPVFGKAETERARKEPTITQSIYPNRIVWQSEHDGKNIIDAKNLLIANNGQAELPKRNLCILQSTSAIKPGLVLDFGRELQGGIRFVTSMSPSHIPVRVRVRLGESVSETMSEIDTLAGATNDHAIRDFIAELPWLGALEIGNSGFRFVRIDLVDANTTLLLKEVSASFKYRDIPYKGSFTSSDTLLNKIWLTGAYTVHLNMQDYLWDGIKRDRLVWVGDMYPEVMTINSVFGYNEVVPKSLDLAKEQAPLPTWMNGISAYSMWWIIIHYQWYYYHGDLKYLQQQKKYLAGLLNLLAGKIDANGRETLDGMRFLDWPSSENKKGVDAGLQALMIIALEKGEALSLVLGDTATAAKCKVAISKLKKNIPDPNQSKQAAALMAIAGIWQPARADKEVISVGGVKDFSTFYGYFMLEAKAKAGNYAESMDNIKTFWGAMLQLGATTFWEDFNMEWMENAAPIDELVPSGKKDIHGDCGAYCYKGFRHSLCHGWASGPTAWLTEHVLGVSITEPGCKTVRIVPHLGNLEWVEGDFPTPFGNIHIRHQKDRSGKVISKITAPAGVKILRS